MGTVRSTSIEFGCPNYDGVRTSVPRPIAIIVYNTVGGVAKGVLQCKWPICRNIAEAPKVDQFFSPVVPLSLHQSRELQYHSFGEMSEDVKKIVCGIWTSFSSLDVRGEILHSLYPQEVIDRTVMEKISRAKASSEAAMHFLMHLESYATIDTLRTLLTILRKTSEGHNRHKELADLLEPKLPKLVSIAI